MLSVKILGLLDIFVAVIFWIFMVFNIQSWSGFVLLLGLFLLVKGIVFITQLSLASILDIISSIFIMVGSSSELPVLVVIIVSLFLLQKGIFSLLS